MKSFNISYTLLAAAAIDAAAIGNLDITTSLKRAVDSTSEIAGAPVDFADAECYANGGPCAIAERDTLALAEAAANVYNAFNSTGDACYASGAPCYLAKRQAIADLENEAAEKVNGSPMIDEDEDAIEDEEDIEKRSPEARKHYCGDIVGEICVNKKRSAEPKQHYCGNIVGEVCVNKKRSAEPSRLPSQHYCGALTGEACVNKKRAVEAVAAVLPRDPMRHYCGLNIGEVCVNKQRSLDNLIALAAKLA